MASFIMKQMVGDKLADVKGAVGGGDAAGAAAAAGPTEEELQARAEAEERRKDKHRKMEHDREKVRKGIRDKYNIEKKDNDPFALPMGMGVPAKDDAADDSLLGKVGLGKATETLSGAMDSFKGLFGGK